MERFSKLVNTFEETVLTVLLAGMTLVTFSQVVARYVFNTGAVWALELTTLMFAWMILFGISYGIKIGTHLGVDAFVNLFPKPAQRVFALAAASACIVYALILFDATWLKLLFGDDVNARGGALEYVRKMHKIGIEMEDLPLQRWIAYFILPLGLFLFAFRCAQAVWQIVKGERGAIIAGHEAEDLVAEHKDELKD